jgi:hypothetical protein
MWFGLFRICIKTITDIDTRTSDIVTRDDIKQMKITCGCQVKQTRPERVCTVTDKILAEWKDGVVREIDKKISVAMTPVTDKLDKILAKLNDRPQTVGTLTYPPPPSTPHSPYYPYPPNFGFHGHMGGSGPAGGSHVPMGGGHAQVHVPGAPVAASALALPDPQVLYNLLVHALTAKPGH